MTVAATVPAAPGSATGSPVGIAPRPPVPADVLAVVVAAVDQAWPRPVVRVAEPSPPSPAWRFSGRWWSRPATVRRDRPWSGG